ncbi:MAG: glycosyltransferase [Lactobacillales bacterium]|jgi:glycosyltransferase involved in cell wall biosynthesis|nr:glycosyltransferase [Lactobacillales bacterium]MDR1254256.1 glycosyltransferase [Oscillospiraceae bacterium]
MISVIVPVYNSQNFLRRCVESLLKQTCADLEIILVNDASPDNSIEIMKEYREKYPEKIIVIDSPINLRQGGARNLGLKAAHGEYIGFVDSDDWVSKGMFAALYDKATKDHSDMVGSQYYTALTEENFKAHQNKYTRDLLEISGKKLTQENKEQLLFKVSGIWSNLYKRSIILDNNIFFLEKTAYEDNHFVKLYTLHINNYSFIDSPYYYYFKNQNSTVNKKNQAYQFDRLEVERKKIKEYKKRNLFEQYKNGIEIDFVKTFYLNTVALIFNAFDKPPIKKLKEIKLELENNFPGYKKNIYYKTALSFEDRLKIDLANMFPGMLSTAYNIKNKLKKG